MGSVLEMRLETEEPAVANTAGEGMRHGAPGRHGGADGAVHGYRLLAPDAEPVDLESKQEGVAVPPGSVFEIHSGGGGGWGDPAKRSDDARARDRRDGIAPDDGT